MTSHITSNRTSHLTWHIIHQWCRWSVTFLCQAQHVVISERHFSSQAQYLVMLQRHSSWQGQRFVMLECHFSVAGTTSQHLSAHHISPLVTTSHLRSFCTYRRTTETTPATTKTPPPDGTAEGCCTQKPRFGHRTG